MGKDGQYHTEKRTEKIRSWLSRSRIAVAVGRTVLTGKPVKSLDKIDHGVEIADKALDIAAMVREMLKKK